MQLHLILPGLLWPGKALHNSAYDLDLPALSGLLGRGRMVWQAPLPLENRLCHLFGLTAAEPPAAALRLLGEGGDPGDGIWLCADPVHLHVEKGRMSFSGTAPVIDAGEAGQIVAALSPFLEEFGEFRCGGDDSHNQLSRGYLRLKALPKLQTVPPSAASGEGRLLPQGEDAPLWRRLSNETQMLLHALPMNAHREETGQPTVNSLWFWGAGALPERQPCAYDLILGDDPLLTGLAGWAGRSSLPPPASGAHLLELPATKSATSALLLLDALQAPMRRYDAMRWAALLGEIEHDWLQPLWQALRSGRLSNLRLTALGDEACLDLTVTRFASWQFWRRPQPLHTLIYPQDFPERLR